MDKMVPCGIEVSARELLVALLGEKEQVVLRRFANTVAGQQHLLQTLTRGGQRVRVCLEATGVYGLDVALLLSAHQQLEVVVANPRAVRHFAQALMRRSKSDPLDALVLWEFAQRMPCRPWVRPEKNTLALWAIARRLEALTKQRTAEKNRAHAAGVSQALPPCVRRSIARTLRALQREIQQLRSVPGIGTVSAIQVLAELLLLPADRDVRQWVAYAGLDPREYSSGTSLRKYPRISKVGNRHLRHALYMPALVASRHEPHLRAFYEQLLARGKKKRPALIAVARKLLHAIYGMFRSGQDYDGARVYRLTLPQPVLLTQIA